MLPRIFVLSLLAAISLTACTTNSGKSSAPPAVAMSALDLPIEQIAGSPNGRAILDKDFPGLRQHAMYAYFKAMSLNQVAAMSKGQITSAMMAQAQIDLATLDTANAAPPSAAPVAAPEP